MSKERPNGLNRRNMLKGTAAGMLAAVSATNAAAKREVELSAAEEADLLREYRSPKMADVAVHEQSDLLEELAADGVLESASIDGLDTLTEPSEGVGEEMLAHRVGDEFTPQIRIFRKTKAGYLSLSVFPEENEAYAILNPVVNGEAFGEGHLETYGNPEDVNTQGCWLGYECEDCNCYEYCCTYDASGDCIQWCNSCDCTCVCCDCGATCSSYC